MADQKLSYSPSCSNPGREGEKNNKKIVMQEVISKKIMIKKEVEMTAINIK